MAANPFAEFAAPAANPFAEFAAPAAPVSEVPGPRQPGFLTGLGRSAASLADVTLGGVLPAAAQQIVYPVMRAGGRTPEQAQAITQGVVSGLEKPFGKAFGVAGTPEYEQEAGRQLMNFIGENFQKGAKWISDRTGLPTADVENIMGTAAIAAPKVAPAAGRAIKETAAPAVQQAVVGAQLPFQPVIAARRERQSLADYARGPQIDAAAEAQRLGIALNPVDIEPSRGAKLTSMLAGPRAPEALANVNKTRVREVALNEMGLPPTTQLNGPDAFAKARKQVAAPYDEVAKLPTMTADDTVRAQLNQLRPDESLIGSSKYAKAINEIVDDAMTKVDAGLTGDQLLKNVQSLRQRARKVYNNKNADLAALDVADTNLAVANALESMIESNIFNPKLLGQFRDARQKMARTYAYEGATDMNTGMVDMKKLSRITAKDNTLTGDIASLGQIAGNFPDVFTSAPTPGALTLPRLSRSGAAGAAGALIGSQFGLTGSILGGALGGALGEGASYLAARRMASPGYQAGLTLRDMRIPVNEPGAPFVPIPRGQAVVPYQTPIEVLGPGEGPYQPNFVFSRQPGEPRVTPVAPDVNRLLGAPSPEATINALRAEDVRRAAVSRTLGREAEAQQAAAEAAARRPATGEVILDFDPITGRFREASQGLKGATPETFSNFGAALQTAADKVTAGKRFDLTAAEKVAWDRTKVDLSEVMPGFKTLTDKAVAEKMLDRAWVEQTVTKAREKAAAFQQIADRAKDERARQTALANRERMMDLADQMEETLGAARPVSLGGQGPKTRAFQRNQMIANQNKNALNR